MKGICFKILFEILLLVISFSCFKPEDYFSEININPNFSILSGADSVKSITGKLKLSSLNDHYSLKFVILDDQENILEMMPVSGEGIFQYDMAAKEFSYFPSQYGFHSFDIIAKDPYGLSDKVHVNLDVFDNLKPVALFSVQKTGNIFKIDASASYDMDSLYGGKITSYVFNVNGNSWSRTTPVLYHDIINGVDNYNISLVVKDNDNALSDSFNQVYSLD